MQKARRSGSRRRPGVPEWETRNTPGCTDDLALPPTTGLPLSPNSEGRARDMGLNIRHTGQLDPNTERTHADHGTELNWGPSTR